MSSFPAKLQAQKFQDLSEKLNICMYFIRQKKYVYLETSGDVFGDFLVKSKMIVNKYDFHVPCVFVQLYRFN